MMGYAIRTRRWRYVEWVRFNRTAGAPRWAHTEGTELYDHRHDEEGRAEAEAAEAVNVVARAEHTAVVTALARRLRQGWRGAHAHAACPRWHSCWYC